MPESDKPLSRSFGRLFFIVLGWTFVAFGLLVALNVFGILVLIIIALVFRRMRRARQQALLWTLAVAAERSIPLVPAIEAFADERSGPARQETRVLARLLKAGTPLPDALSIVGGMVPEEAVVPIQVGQELGALDQGLRQATAPTGPYQAVWDHFAGKVAYLCFLVLFATAIITFIMLKIVPAFQKIFMDFGADLPAMTRFTIYMAQTAFASPIPLLCVVFLIWLFIYAILRYIGAISWDLPLVGRLVRRLHAARVLDSLAMAVERNQPLFKTVATLARCYPKPSIRRRLQVVLVDVTAGVDVAESLRSRGLISRADMAVLHAAQRVGNLAWAMREIADSNRRRLAYRAQAWIQILFPAAILTFGLMVLLLVAGCFMPLVALIQKLS
jgi:type II secretory pathway component PulF